MTPSQKDIDIMIRTVYGEAEANNRDDAIAIAWVIVNRTNLPNWPNNIMKVCQQPWQFSCWNKGDPNRERITKALRGVGWMGDIETICNGVLSGSIPDVTGRATHYYATFIAKPKWADGKIPCHVVQHRNNKQHLFFNDIDTPKPLIKSRTIQVGAVAAVTGLGTLTEAVPPAFHETALDTAMRAAPAVETAVRIGQSYPLGLAIFAGVALVAFGVWLIYHRIEDRKKGIK